MSAGYITYKRSRIHYVKTGEGAAVTICFHGFGEDATSFNRLGEGLVGHMLIAIDLPFHGKTEWNEGLSLSVQELMEIISLCPDLQERSFGLMGYSMGGKVALSVFEAFPKWITHMILVAPDGLRPAPWHWFGTKTRVGNRLLRFTMTKPGWFKSLLDTARSAGFINESIYKFVNLHLDDPVLREKVYRIWTTLRNFRPDTTAIKHYVSSHEIPVYMLFGKYDRLCPYPDGRSFAKGLGELCRMEIVETGHLLMHSRFLAQQMEAFEFCLNGMIKEPE
jgi:pimeloyl-ACP methyl ester carboxylesterase